MRRALVTAAIAAGTMALPASADAADTLYAVDLERDLISFSSDKPGEILSSRRIEGLPPGERIEAMDFRPADGKLYAVGTGSQLWRIDTSTGVASVVGSGTFEPRLNGTAFGFDFNPTVDRIRVVSESDQNLRVNPNDGKVAAVDRNLAYEVGTSSHHVVNPEVIAAAYTNNVAGATATQLYGLDAYDSYLVVQDPPNDGTVRRVGRVTQGLPPRNVSLDITPEGTGYAAFRPRGEGQATLYRVDFDDQLDALRPAAADPVIGDGIDVTALAAAVPSPADPKPTVGVTAKRRVSRQALRRAGLAVATRCSEACRIEITLSEGSAVLARASDQLGSAGFVRVQLRVGKRALPGRGRRKLILRVTATDSGGNSATVRRGVVAR